MRRHRTLAIAAVLLAGLLALAGCSDDSTAPVPPASQAPQLPDAALLTPHLDFFDSGAQADKAVNKDNFFNAYLRVVVIDLMVQYHLTPPVAAFALALHTPPSPQNDGSWIWVYTFVDGEEIVQVELRGLPVGDSVEWALRVSAPSATPPFADELWFDGVTRHDGDAGEWTFYDFNLPGKPAVASLAWGAAADGDYLTLTSLYGNDAGDTLTFRDGDPEQRLEFVDAPSQTRWFIRWNELTGTGSLKVPDYNGGNEACWDEHQDNAACPVAK